MNKLIIVGAGGHGKVVANNALKNGYTDICFVDDKILGECMGFPIIGKCKDLIKFNDGKTDFIIGIGNNEIRKIIAETYNVNWVTICHPSAVVAEKVLIGKGTVVMAGVVINCDSTIGEHSIINTGTIVEHDIRIGDYVHLSPGVSLGGTVQVGNNSHIGIGATVINNIEICAGCVIGAGALVVRSINEEGTYVGVPVRKIK